MIDFTESLIDQVKTITKAHSFDIMQDHCKELRKALKDLVEQIDTLDGIELSKDLKQDEAETCWNAALSQARKVLR